MIDCITSELKAVKDSSLIQYVSELIQKQEFRSLYESFCKKEEFIFSKNDSDQDQNDNDLNTECKEIDVTSANPDTIRGQEEDKEEDKEKQQEVLYSQMESNPDSDHTLHNNQKLVDVKEIIEFWDNNGFGFSNLSGKQQLLAWLDDSKFLQPKAVILKAMNIACANNKRRLTYVVGILKNWENESLLSVEEIDSYIESRKPVQNHWQSKDSFPRGRDIPSGYDFDITAGEDW